MHKLLFTIFYLSLGIIALSQGNQAYADSAIMDSEIPRDERYTVDTTLSQYSFATSNDSVKNYGTLKNFPYMFTLDSALRAVGKLPIDTIDLDGPVTASKPGVQRRTMAAKGSSISLAVRLILWIAAVSFLLFIIYRLFANGNIFKDQNSGKTASPSIEQIAADTGDYDSFISQAIANKNFRLAIRYLYLKTLHILSASNLIKISSDKTNYQYIKEMSRHSTSKEFIALTSSYEYVWYGKFEVDQYLFERVEKNFKTYFQHI